MAKKMQFGVMQRGVFDWDEDMAARFQELMEQARLLDKLGYDSITKGSHFSTYPHRECMQIPYLCRVMAEAPNLRLNAGVVLLSLRIPSVTPVCICVLVDSKCALLFWVQVPFGHTRRNPCGDT